MECEEVDNIVDSTEKKNDADTFEVENNVLSKLRNCTLIPRTLSDFQAFVGRLVNDPISDAVVEEVWRHIYISRDSGQSPINNNKSTDSHVVSQMNYLVGKDSENSNERVELSEVDSANATKESHEIVSDNYMPKSDDQTQDHVYFEEQNDVSSSDCEVVEVVSLNKSNDGNNNHSCSKSDEYDTDSYESESDKSVEILELKKRSKADASSDEEQPCRIHGRTSFQNSYNIPEYSNCASQNTQKCYKHLNKDLNVNQINVSYDNSVNRKKKIKYKKLKSEVKNLKCLLENLLKSVDGSGIENTNDKRESLQALSRVDFEAGVSSETVKTKKLSTNECNILEGRMYSSRKKCKKKKFQKEDKAILHDKFNSATDEKNSSKITKIAADLLKKKLQSTEHSKSINEFHRSPENICDLNAHFPDANEKKRRKFKWRDVIAETLKESKGNRMQIEKLKRKVIARYYYYRGSISKNTEWKFFKYLRETSGVVIDTDVAIYSNRMKTQISSKSESKKQFVMKTVTRTKEYKMS